MQARSFVLLTNILVFTNIDDIANVSATMFSSFIVPGEIVEKPVSSTPAG